MGSESFAGLVSPIARNYFSKKKSFRAVGSESFVGARCGKRKLRRPRGSKPPEIIFQKRNRFALWEAKASSALAVGSESFAGLAGPIARNYFSKKKSFRAVGSESFVGAPAGLAGPSRPKLFFKKKNVSRCGKLKLRRRSGRPRGSHRPKLFFKKKSFPAVVCHVFDYLAGLINTGNIHVLKWAFESGCPVILSGDFIW